MMQRQEEITLRLRWMYDLFQSSYEATLSGERAALVDNLDKMADLLHDLQQLAAEPGKAAQTVAAARDLPGQTLLFGPMNPTE